MAVRAIAILLGCSLAAIHADKVDEAREGVRNAIKNIMTTPPSQEDLELFAQQADALMANPEVQEQFEAFNEQLHAHAKLFKSDPDFQRQLQSLLADPSVQQQTEMMQDHVESLVSEPASLAQVSADTNEMPSWQMPVQKLAMMLLANTQVSGFAFNGAPGSAVSAKRSQGSVMRESVDSRREVLKFGAGAVGALAFADKVSAKAGQFTRQDVFGQTADSSPYVEGGIADAGDVESGDSTFGYKTSGKLLAKGWENDVTREKAVLTESAKIVSDCQPFIDSKSWYLARDALRGQTSFMRDAMLAINDASKNKAALEAAYKKFWGSLEDFDYSCKVKNKYGDVQSNYDNMKTSLSAYRALV